ncbi:hypothetical protein [Xanthomonas rydalmerensis]|uniref:3-dehydroquinate dehydratase n=1 Tax=Xanthomonas rydalmerensis TaxID=3046274 RepID=A0ABZ0JNA8_9XANT|nr:hypothetical protein [Xanthomonas sp. DM-2023]WOS40473.1 hypothetical protein QN243_19100 [Xanthomonas sp. DM-2023]WOS44657.1 hypothetical protein QN242_19100 [Xanthomonas sp. DM-2023]WOS48837.1 hypothetical protein QN240_19100 [Xanthomonas sp. DM-2023]WOS53017.1 hypothetical protein QN244_19105 [Xanthomonas sp. DM-2023]WOS57201.1 hypothetical protein QN245_19100 [Xanthomonas sp. DM-2023]
MSILLIQGPHRDASAIAAAQCLAASHAAQVVPVACADAAQIVARLRQGACDDTELVLLDSGELPASELADHGAQLCAALDALGHPYIEMHDASAQALELLLHPRHAPLLTVIANGALADSYAIALGVAQRRLGARAALAN